VAARRRAPVEIEFLIFFEISKTVDASRRSASRHIKTRARIDIRANQSINQWTA